MADYRGYVTAAGQEFEALAKEKGYPVTIGVVEIGDGILPDNESPINRTKLVNKIREFPAIVEQNKKAPEQWVVTCFIPVDDSLNGEGYNIREMGCKLVGQGAGILHSYRRIKGDWKPVLAEGEAKSFIYKLRFIPSHGELITPTVDPSIVYVNKEELAEAIHDHETGEDRHEIAGVKGLQVALDGKASKTHTHPGTLTNPFSLVKEDLNTITKPGAYRQDNDGNATLALNYPEAKSGSLIVTVGAGVQHRYHVYNTSRVYTRAQYDTGAFTPWARDYNTLNKPTPDELGAYPKTGGYLDGGIDAKDAIYGRVGLIARSRAGSTWLGIETPENGDPYISARASGEIATAPALTFAGKRIRAHKLVHSDSMQVQADAGLRFAPTDDWSGTTWGLGINLINRTWGLHRYSDGVWNASPFWVNATGSVGMSALAVSGGSESSYHQVKNAGNPSVELHEPGKFAVMMYKPQGTSSIRFVQSNGAGGEAKAYGVVDADGFGTVEGRFRAAYPAANRSWAGLGQCQFWGESINSGNGALLGLVGHQYVIPGKYSMEHILGSYLSDNPDLSTFVLSACDGATYRRTWQFRNNGEVIAPQNWSINSAGEMYPSRLGGSNLIDWCQSGFAYKSHTHTAAQGNQDIVAGGWGQIGTYMLAAVIPGHSGAMNPTATIAGSSLRPANCSEWGQNRDWALPGTWKCLGFVTDNADDRWDDRTTLWIRIA